MTKRQASALAILLVALVPACGKKGGAKPLGDKKTACDNIYQAYSSHQDPNAWGEACMAAPDETVRCVNLIMEEGKDAACKKLVSSPERTKLVLVLNGKPEAPAPAPAPTPSPDPAPAVAGGSPIAVKDLGTYVDNDMQENKRGFEVTNNGKAVVTHLQFYVFYYDKDKQSLGGGQGHPDAMNYPESLGIKPGEKKVLAIGFEQGHEPEGTAFVEAALTEVDFADGTSWKNEKDGSPDRPMGGAP